MQVPGTNYHVWIDYDNARIVLEAEFGDTHMSAGNAHALSEALMDHAVILKDLLKDPDYPPMS